MIAQQKDARIYSLYANNQNKAFDEINKISTLSQHEQ